jgi:tetratricopeptide (TPR) repeat protein
MSGRGRGFDPSVDGWRDVEAVLNVSSVLEEVVRFRKARFVLVGGNRRACLSRVGDRARASGWVVGSAFDEPPAGSVGWLSDVADVGQFAAGVGSVWVPWLGAVAALGPLAHVVKRRLARAATGPAPDVLAMMRELIAGAEGRPVALVIDNPESEEFIAELLQVSGRYGLLSDEPVVLFVGVDDAPADIERAGRDASSLVQAAAWLVKNQSVPSSWVWVPTLDGQQVVKQVRSIDRTSADVLAAAAGGDDEAATTLWHDWSEKGILAYSNGAWVVDQRRADGYRHSSISDRVWRGVGGDPGRLERARVALAVGALQGRRFCGEAIAQTVGETRADADYDSVTDDLDDLADEDNERRIVATDGYVTAAQQQGQAFFWRYRFLHATDVQWFRPILGSDTDLYLHRLLHQLLELHDATGAYDGDIARLARQANLTDVAVKYRARHASKERLDALESHAALLLATHRVADVDIDDPYIVFRLVDTTRDLLAAGLVSAAIECSTAAVERARVAASNPKLAVQPEPREVDRTFAVTLVELARALLAGGDAAGAVSRLEEALTHIRELYGATPTPASRRDLTATLYTLGQALHAEGDAAGAVSRLEEALTHDQELHVAAPTPNTRRSLAATLKELGGALLTVGDATGAVSRLEEACTHIRELNEGAPTSATRRDLAATLHEHGQALLVEGDVDGAVSRFEEALTHTRELYEGAPTPASRRELAVTLYTLGQALLAEGDTAGAVSRLEEALTHDQELHEAAPTPATRRSLAATLHDLGRALHAEGDVAGAVSRIKEALTLIQGQ